MSDSIVVYRLLSENPAAEAMNISFQMAMALRNMGIARLDMEHYEVIREGNTTVTVYTYRKV